MGCTQSIDTQNKLIKKPINSDQVIQFFQNLKPNQLFQQELTQFKIKITSLQNDPLISGITFWYDIIKRFDDLCLDKDQQLELLQFMVNFIKTNIQKQNGLSENQFMKQMGQKYNQFEKRIYLKHKMCLQYFKYVKLNNKNKENHKNRFHGDCLKFDMSLQETKMVAQKVRQFCEVNMDAFSFLSLYLIHCANKLHQQGGMSFLSIQQLLDENLKQLQKIYPPTIIKQDKQNNNNHGQQQSTIDLSVIKFIKTNQMIALKPIIGKSKYHQVEEYIIKKAQLAIQDEELFVQLIKSICLQKGYAFKSGLKIKDPLQTSSIQRTFQKLLSTSKHQPILKEFKSKSISNTLPHAQRHASPPSQQNKKCGLKQYVVRQKHLIMQKVKQILDKQTQLQFNIKDLLRAKCMFNSVQDIKETLLKLNQNIVSNQLSIYEIKDRLNKKTKDITVIINLPNTRAQLQLALKFDKVFNQFNHKIYQLLRSIKFTMITNIQIQNEKWSDTFFNSQLYLFYRMLKMQKQKDFNQQITFKQLKQDVEVFIKSYLENDFLGINLIARQQPNAQKIIQKSFNQLNQILLKNVKAFNKSIR